MEECILQGSALNLVVLNIFTNNLDDGIKYVLMKSTDSIKLTEMASRKIESEFKMILKIGGCNWDKMM